MKPRPWNLITPLGIANNHFREQALQGNLGHHVVQTTWEVLINGGDYVREVLRAMFSFTEEDFRRSIQRPDRNYILLELHEEIVLGVIDVYDLTGELESQDPCDDDVTMRVLSIMIIPRVDEEDVVWGDINHFWQP